MEKVSEGAHTRFLRQITGNRARWNPDGKWVTLEEGKVQEEAGMQLEATYTGRRQGEVYQWVALHLIFEVFTREKGYEGRRCRRGPQWQHEALENILRSTLEDIYHGRPG